MTSPKRDPEETEGPTGREWADEIYSHLDMARATLWEIAHGDEKLDPETRAELESNLHDALQIALAERSRRYQLAIAEDDPRVERVTIGDVVARSVKTLRTSTETDPNPRTSGQPITQQQLADYMNRLGFVGWKRITVAEVESGKRRLSIEEMMGIAALFDVPVSYLLAAFEPGESVVLNERIVLTQAQAQELITGEPIDKAWFGIRLVDTTTGRVLASPDGTPEFDEDWRPARDGGYLWGEGQDGEHEGQFVIRDRRFV